MSTVGEVLKNARLKNKLTIEDIVTRTNIRSFYIKAIESNRFDDLPEGGAYHKAFIKNYAQNVGVDLDEIVSLYQHLLEQKDLSYKDEIDSNVGKSSEQTSGANPAAIAAVILIALVIAIIATRQYQAKQNERTSKKQVEKIEIVKPEKNAVSIELEEDEVSVKNLGEVAETSIETSEVSEVEVSGPPALKLKGKALKDVRFTLRIDKRGPQEFNLKAGELMEWGAYGMFTLNLPDAGGIEWSLDGSEPQILGNSGQFLENIVIKKK